MGSICYLNFASCITSDTWPGATNCTRIIRWRPFWPHFPWYKKRNDWGRDNGGNSKEKEREREKQARINFPSLKLQIKFFVRWENSCVKRRLAKWYRQFFIAKFLQFLHFTYMLTQFISVPCIQHFVVHKYLKFCFGSVPI